VRKSLLIRPYKLQLLHALTLADREKRFQFCCDFQQKIEEDEGVLSKSLFSGEATFHVHGKVNRRNVHVWGTEQPRRVVEHERNSLKVNVFCAMSKAKIYGPFFLAEKTIGEFYYLDMLQSWLFPQLEQDEANIILQLDGAPPHFHREVRSLLNGTLPHRWIGRGADDDDMFLKWPPRSPDLTPLDFYFWGYIKDKVYVPPLP
jgi:hypothetical protein